jgi:hypothetical protein
MLFRMQANGPAIECVNGAECIEAGAVKPNREIVLAPAERSEARRDFCRPGTNLLAYTSVAVQC